MLDTVSVPEQFEPIFQKAQDYVSTYFGEKKEDASKGKIEIFGQRYILVRAASMSVDFFDTIKNMFKDFGDEKASEIARSLLFDVAHAIGMMDARNFHQKMGVKEPIEKLSAGPIHFSHTGWAFVDILAESRPTPDEHYYLIYDHPFSFEADAWEESGKNSTFCVCAMNAGYSSGWCEESFGIPLVTSEIMCRAKGDSTCRFIMAHPSKIGQYLQEYLRVHPDISDNATLYRIGGFFQERKQAETALRKSEERFKQVAENAGEWIWEVNAEGLYTYSSPTAEKILGYKPEEIVGKKYFYDFFAPDVKEKLKKAAFEVFAKGESFRGFINPNIHKNGSTVIFETNGTPIVDDKGNLCGYRGADRDITERKRAQEELEKTNEELKKASSTAGMAEVATDVLHNVGNVLNSINVSVNCIEEKVLNSKADNLKKVADMIAEHTDDLGTFLTEDQRGKHIPVFLTEAASLIVDEQAYITEKLQSLIKNVEHIKQIIHAQQRYAKTGGVEVFTSINDIIKDAMEINSAGLKRHGVKYKLELAELPEFHMDKQRILQILVNLIINGKYSLSKSEKQEKLLTIRSYKHSEDRLRVDVADNGVGISNENMAKIFRHGFTTRKHGHGFGLHSSALAAKEMGGSLTTHSDGPGNGATFTLELPLKSKEVTECTR